MNDVAVMEQTTAEAKAEMPNILPAKVVDDAKVLIASGAFPDVKTVGMAIAKCEIGRALGFDATTSMMNIHFYNGKPIVGYGMIAAAVKRTDRYDYRVKKIDNKVCLIEFFERIDGELVSLGEFSYTWEDAVQAGNTNKDTYKKHPRNMLFARCISNGYKFFCPDALGVTVYTNEERDLLVQEAAVEPEPEPVDLITREAAEALAQHAADSPMSEERLATLCLAYGLPEHDELVERLAHLPADKTGDFAGEIGGAVFEEPVTAEVVEEEPKND